MKQSDFKKLKIGDIVLTIAKERRGQIIYIGDDYVKIQYPETKKEVYKRIRQIKKEEL